MRIISVTHLWLDSQLFHSRNYSNATILFITYPASPKIFYAYPQLSFIQHRQIQKFNYAELTDVP